MQPTSSSASTDHEDQAYPTNNAGAKHSLSTSSDSFDLQPPTPKSSRIATMRSGSKHKQTHSSPIDNIILYIQSALVCLCICT